MIGSTTKKFLSVEQRRLLDEDRLQDYVNEAVAAQWWAVEWVLGVALIGASDVATMLFRLARAQGRLP